MKQILLITFAVIALSIMGCRTQHAPDAGADPSVIDITPTATAEAHRSPTASADQPPVPAPTYTPAPELEPTVTPAPDSRATYTIRKGDTYYSIARTQYGSGKDWQRIASANPGVEPSNLQIGQKIVIP